MPYYIQWVQGVRGDQWVQGVQGVQRVQWAQGIQENLMILLLDLEWRMM